MHFSFFALAATVLPLVSGAPAVTTSAHARRAAVDILVLKFADVLEQLESTFYEQALTKFKGPDFTAAGFSTVNVAVEQFLVIQKDEATHSTVLQAALKSFGAQPITSCKFKFDSVLTDVATMAATARVVENVGVAAYLGGASLISDPVLLTAAASILTVEARHSTVLNILSGTGTSVPSAFDFALTPSEILALAGGFFDGPCDVGITSNPPLAITNTGAVGPGTKLTFSSPALGKKNDTSKLFCQMLIGGMATALPFPFNDCVVPAEINGPVAIFITSDAQPLLNDVRDRDTVKLVAGPTLAFIDTDPQTLGSLARSNSSDPVVITSTATISPAEASSIILAATATETEIATATATDATATATISATGAAPTQTGTTVSGGVPLSATANLVKGPSKDGLVDVVGWSNHA